MWVVAALALFALLANLPLGAWRVRVRPYSFAWFMAVHLSVPFIWALRMLCGVGLPMIPVLILFAVAGQLVGGRLFPPRDRDDRAKP
jgi:hypothetical protein